jgi:retron-type reverse transcriptase
VQEEDSQLVPREKGTPQGGVISPLLANLFLHYTFDCQRQLNIPQFPPIENSPVAPVEISPGAERRL